MCTSISFNNGASHYFGRNLDLEIDFPVEVTIAPREFPFNFRHMPASDKHYAIIGMGMVENGFPLFFDGVNEKGLGLAGLAFATTGHYFPVEEGKTNVASFELLPFLLGSCATVEEARKLITNLNITDDAFAPHMTPAPLHWLLADEKESIVLESEADGLHVYDNPWGVLTNEPPFSYHRWNISTYLDITNQYNQVHFSKDFPGFLCTGNGMGTFGLPGGVDPVSRFVRVAFTKLNSVCDDEELVNVQQYYHIMQSVGQTRGSDTVANGEYEVTQFTDCTNTKTGTFYYTMYSNQSMNSVELFNENLDSADLITYPVIRDLQVNCQNKK